MSRFTEFAEKYLKKNKKTKLKYTVGKGPIGSDVIALNFFQEVKLHWLFHVGFGEIRLLKWH